MDGISRLPLCNHLLQQTLRGVCVESEWVYSVFWRILPRNFPPPKWELGGYLERSKANKRNWILVWEDGFCDFARSRTADTDTDHAEADVQNPCCISQNRAEQRFNGSLHPELFFKMSHEIYNYGEGLMGKVAADNGHKWIYRDPPERDNRLVSFWHNTIDPQPRTWEAQFKCGIQTIVVVAVHEGLVQLGSTRQILEDPNFVVLVQRKFNSLQQVAMAMSSNPSPRAGTLVSPDHQSTSSLERKMRHARPDYDEDDQPALTRTLERRLSWTSTADSRLSRPLPPPLSPNYDNVHAFQQQSPLPLARDVQAAADHLSNSTSSVLPSAGPRQWQGASHLDPSQADYLAHMQLRAASPSISFAAAVTCTAPSLLPSMSTLQALLSKLPAVTTTSLSVLDQQSINGKSEVQDHSPLLRTLSAPTPARSGSSSAVRSNDVLPDVTWRNVTSSCDQLLSFHSRMTNDHDSFLATTPPSPRQQKFEQGTEATVANCLSSTVDDHIKGMQLQQPEPLLNGSPVAVVVQLEQSEAPAATSNDQHSYQKRADDHPTASMYCTSPLNSSMMA